MNQGNVLVTGGAGYVGAHSCKALSQAGYTPIVYDNLSTDRTVEQASSAGAIVRRETVKGKGNVVRRAFADIDADVYVMIDGDDTYDAAAAPLMIKTLLDGPYDHVLGVRKQEAGADAYRAGHETGNKNSGRYQNFDQSESTGSVHRRKSVRKCGGRKT